MLSWSLMGYCVLAAGGYLLVFSLIWELIGKRLHLTEGIPDTLLEESTSAWFVMNFILELLFFVAIPTVAYSFFYLVLPYTGVRAGVAATLAALTLGAVPIVMGLSVRVKIPMPFLLFYLVGYLLKLGGSMVIVGYVYSL